MNVSYAKSFDERRSRGAVPKMNQATGKHFKQARGGYGLVAPTLLGAAILCPGLALFTVGGVSLQPFYAISALIVAQAVVAKPQALLISGVYILGAVAAMLASVAFGFIGSTKIAMFSGAALAIAFAGLFAVVVDDRARSVFMKSIVFSAAVSGLIAVGQALFSSLTGVRILLTNNQNFSLIAPLGRGSAFTPEPSVLGAMLAFGLAIAVLPEAEFLSIKTSKAKRTIAAVLLLAGLVATRSTATLAFLALVAILALYTARDRRAALKMVLQLSLVAAISLPAFWVLYSERLERSDATRSSIYRYEKMLTGINIWKQHPLTGAGLGAVSDASFFGASSSYSSGFRFEKTRTVIRRGVDSEFIRILAEEGVVGILAHYWPIIAALFSIPFLGRKVALSMFVCAIPLLWSLTMSGYRDVPFGMLPTATALALIALFVSRAGSVRSGDLGTRTSANVIAEYI